MVALDRGRVDACLFRPMHTRLFQFLSAFFDQDVIEAYSAEYCHFLELAYGKNWMSEGGEQAAENLCDGHRFIR